jgi:hypothetical protein
VETDNFSETRRKIWENWITQQDWIIKKKLKTYQSVGMFVCLTAHFFLKKLDRIYQTEVQYINNIMYMYNFTSMYV